MTTRPWPVLVISCALCVTPAAEAEVLSLGRCVALALERSPASKAGAENVRAAQAAYDAARSHYRPFLFGELTHDQLFYRPYDFAQRSGLLHLDWSAGDRLLDAAAAPRQEILVQQAESRWVDSDLTRQVAHLYISALQRESRLELLRHRQQVLEGHLLVSQAMWRAGTRTQFDVFQTRAAASRLEEQVLELKAEADSLQWELARLTGIEDSQAIELRPLGPQAANLDSLPAAAVLDAQLTSNPLLRTLELESEAERLRRREIRASRLPHLALNGGYVADGDPTAAGNYWLAGVSLQAPLVRWGLTRHEEDEIEARARSLRFQADRVHLELRIQSAQVRGRLVTMQQLGALRAERLQNAQQALQLADENYRAGLSTNLEYLAAQGEMLDAEEGLQEARAEYFLGLVDLYILTGQADRVSNL